MSTFVQERNSALKRAVVLRFFVIHLDVCLHVVSAILVVRVVNLLLRLHTDCVVCELDIGAHTWLFGERYSLQLLALGRVSLQVMETTMGGVDHSTHAQAPTRGDLV